MVKTVRPRAAALAAAVGAMGALALATPSTAPAAPAGSTGPAAPAGAAPADATSSAATAGAGTGTGTGLYGLASPDQDGVERQSLALLALDSQHITPSASAVRWLTAQQCENGGWTAYRPEPGTAACPAGVESTTATAAAIQALSALGGHQHAVDQAVDWLRRTQAADGTWADLPDAPHAHGAAAATAAANSALRAARLDPRQVRPVLGTGTGIGVGVGVGTGTETGTGGGSSGGSSSSPSATAGDGGEGGGAGGGGNAPNAYDALHSFQLGTTVPSSQRGAFADLSTLRSSPGHAPPPDDALTARAALPIGGGYLPLTGRAENTAPAAYAASYLSTRIRAGGEHLDLPGSSPAQPDYASTAYAVLSLAHAGRPADARDAMDWLASHADDWTSSTADPTSALSLLVLTADATDLNPRDLGGGDRLAALLAQGPRPAATPSAPVRPAETASPRRAEDSVSTLWWIVGLAATAAIAAPLLRRYSRPRRH
ncbi:prenyltransferase/squalene oxidase repeat-containing protein [Phaeacidiphilus oryzae]|uniref:prenyltransferase/squalene oxidase repeat-containing protein n=1 Tax=Phaeacidiphilus oryzae TaxID=348818 RepID=UPI00056A804A|nr:prenyltransferase/squalene oxidase repeat-containing protein [Phaeacidiphilus oryzae]